MFISYQKFFLKELSLLRNNFLKSNEIKDKYSSFQFFFFFPDFFFSFFPSSSSPSKNLFLFFPVGVFEYLKKFHWVHSDCPNDDASNVRLSDFLTDRTKSHDVSKTSEQRRPLGLGSLSACYRSQTFACPFT